MKPNNSVIVEEWQVYLHSFFNFYFKNILNIQASILPYYFDFSFNFLYTSWKQ